VAKYFVVFVWLFQDLCFDDKENSRFLKRLFERNENVNEKREVKIYKIRTLKGKFQPSVASQE